MRSSSLRFDSGGRTFLQRGSPTPTSLASAARILLKAEMAKGQQAVIGVLSIHHCVAPMSIEPAFVRPERVDKVQASILRRAERLFQRGQGMQGSGGRE